MPVKKEEFFFPDFLWKVVKDFLFTRPGCLLCGTLKKKRGGSEMPTQSQGFFLCKCVRNPTDSTFKFSYACTRHYALNTAMKISLAQKEMFYRAREVVTCANIGTKDLRTRISASLTKNDLMRLLCSKRNKVSVGEEVLKLCQINY